MLTGLRAQEQLVGGGKLGNAVARELMALVGDLQGWSSAQHADDGTHTAVTAQSLATEDDVTVGGDLTVDGDLTVAGGNAGVGDQPISGGVIGGYGTKLGRWYLVDDRVSAPSLQGLRLQYRSTAGADLFALLVLPTAAGEYTITGDTVLRLGGTVPGTRRITSIDANDIHALNGLTEHGRTAKIGDYTPVTFNAANFTGVGQTWTVASGNVVEFKYRRTGKTLRGKYFVQATSTGGAGATELDIALPDGAIANGRNPGLVWINMNGTYEIGTTQTSHGGTVLKVFRQDPASTFGAFTGTLGLRGEFEIEVQ